MRKITIKCPAKINLTLKITGKRPDGFHNIESVMQAISLYDYLDLKLSPSDKLEINLSGNSAEIPYDNSNLVYKAAKLYFDTLEAAINNYILKSCHVEFEKDLQDEALSVLADSDMNFSVDIHIDKNIPVAAGLAGGSTDAAGTVFGLNKLLNEPLSISQLHDICSKLGSDLNFCLAGGTQLTTGRGEILSKQNFTEQKVALIKPLNLGISAKEAYTKFSNKFSKNSVGRENYVNDLEWAIIDDYPQLQFIKNKYPNSVMSGSGSTFYQLDNNFDTLDGYQIINNLVTIPDGVSVV